MKDKRMLATITKMRNANKLIFEIEVALAEKGEGAMRGVKFIHPDITSLATGLKIKSDHINSIVNPGQNKQYEGIL